MKTNLHHLLTPWIRSPSAHRAAGRYGSMRGSLTGALCVILMQVTSMQNSWSLTNADMFKLYAHTLIVDYKEFQCLDKLWVKESNWNIAAHNKSGGAYGIPQLKNKKLKHMDGFTQVEWGIKYIKHRHKTPCLAWSYWLKHKNY